MAAPDPTYNGVFGNPSGAAPSQTWAPTVGDGGSLIFTTGTDNVKVPAVNLGSGFTVMGWIRPDGAQSPWARFLCTERFQTGFFLGRDANTSAWKLILNGNFDLPNGGTVESDRWQHVCATYDGSEATLYVNGEPVSSGFPPSPTVPVQPLYFGTESGIDRSFTGAWDDIKFHTGALSPEAVAAIHTAESPAHANPSLALNVVSFTRDAATGAFTFAWESDASGAATYRLAWSTDLSNWDSEIEAVIPSQGSVTSHTFANPSPTARCVYFRAELNP